MKTPDKNTDYFGLDIGTTGVRMVQLLEGEEAPELSIHGSRSVDPEVSMDNDKDLAKFIKRAVEEVGITTKDAVVAIPNRYAFTTVITTPPLEPEELGRYVNEQAPQLLPMPLEQVRLDWHVINPDKEGQMEVLVVAASADAVERYIKLVNKAGLNLRALEINALAMARSVVGSADSAIVVVDLGNTDTEITAIWGRTPHVVSSVDVGVGTLAESVEQSFNVDSAQAYDFLHKFGFLETKLEGQVRKATADNIRTITEETSKVIESFLAANTQLEIKKLILTGGPAALPGLPAYIADELNMSVEIANPWTNIVYPAVEHDKLMNESLYFAVAVGLAQKAFI